MDYTPSELQDFFCFSVCPRKKEKPISLKGVKPEQILSIKILLWRIPFGLYSFGVTGFFLFFCLPKKKRETYIPERGKARTNTFDKKSYDGGFRLDYTPSALQDFFIFLPEKRKRNLYHKSASEERNTE